MKSQNQRIGDAMATSVVEGHRSKNSELKETVLAARMVCKLAAMPSQTKRTYVAQVERFAPMHVTIASEI